jgi:hypothetical protein
MIKIVNPDKSGIFFVKIQSNAPGPETDSCLHQATHGGFRPHHGTAGSDNSGATETVPHHGTPGSDNSGATETVPHHGTAGGNNSECCPGFNNSLTVVEWFSGKPSGLSWLRKGYQD